jgi:hypothetical protein
VAITFEVSVALFKWKGLYANEDANRLEYKHRVGTQQLPEGREQQALWIIEHKSTICLLSTWAWKYLADSLPFPHGSAYKPALTSPVVPNGDYPGYL